MDRSTIYCAQSGKVARLYRFAEEFSLEESYLNLTGWDEDEVDMIVPEDDEENMIIDLFLLSMSSGWNSVSADYAIVKDYTKKYDLDTIDVFRVVKGMCGIYNKNMKRESA